MIVATAGHVDHGKTSLVKALTGVDTDRLAEEKRRGMTIEPGFAYAEWEAADAPGSEPIGFVDVPGHERFVRNMLAGVAGVDLGLLVVAADDGPMPQTREHLAILTLLGVPQLALVVSKVDRVPPERLAQAGVEIDELLAGGPYARAPRFPVAAIAGLGVTELREHLAHVARALAQRPAAGHFRMAVDRSFTMAGAGRVVTGVVLSGQVEVGDDVLVSPAGTAARVRSLHAQNRPGPRARAGQRCALNLTGPELKRAEPQRGDWVLAPAAHAPTDRLDVQLDVLAGAAPLSPRSALQLHLGAAVRNVCVATLADHGLTPGSRGLARLLLDRPVAAAHADRFILRDPAANRTLAGGWVVDPFGPVRGRSRPQRLAQLATLGHADAALALAALLANEPDGVNLSAFSHARNLRPDEAERLYDRLNLKRVPARSGLLGLSEAHWQTWRARVLAALDGWHARHPESVGPQPAELRMAFGPTSDPSGDPRKPQAVVQAVVQAVLAALIEDGLVARDSLRHRCCAHHPRLSPGDGEVLDRVTALLLPAGLRPPIVGDLATELGLPRAELLDHLIRLAASGQLVRVAPNRFYLPATVTELMTQARALASEQADGSIDAAGYRDRTGVGRNLTVQVLEFFRREGMTRFDGQRHQLLS